MVDDSLWTTDRRLSSVGDSAPKGDRHQLTLAGRSKAFNVANRANMTEHHYEALEALRAFGGHARIETRIGQKITPTNREYANRWFELSCAGYVEPTYCDPSVVGDGRGYRLTEKGETALANADKEQASLLDRIRQTCPL